MTRRMTRGCRAVRSTGRVRYACRNRRVRWAPATWNSPATSSRCHCASGKGVPIMLDNLSALDVAGRLGLAIAMAVFMGLAFEGVYKREQHTCPGGIRTFPMLAALGAMLFLLDAKSLLPFVAGLAAVAIW